MIRQNRPDLIYANFFFTDIVGLSNPNMSTTTQFKKLEVLNKIIQESNAYKNTPKTDMITFPTGDGMCIGFTKDQETPMLLAFELHKKLYEYNKGKIPSEIIQIRIGLAGGNCFTFKDINENINVWGPGIIVTKRIMDIGDANHILLSQRFAEDLRELSDEYMKIIKPIQDYAFKHGITMLVYSAYGQGFGNPIPPKQEQLESMMQNEIIKLQNTALYPCVDVTLELANPKSMSFHHKRTYQIRNISDEPIRYVLHGIATDVEKNDVSDLNIKTYDESGEEMRISSINLNQPFCKEFSTVFKRPILKGQESRAYTLEYDVEEPEGFFENNFAIDCKKFILRFAYNEGDLQKHPQLYYLNQETEEKTPDEAVPIVSKNDSKTTLTWEKENLVKGQTLRLEWQARQSD
ncbi:MAG TPA: hypothetical protein VGA92_07045 [Candidatus Nitrosotenuis sp.]